MNIYSVHLRGASLLLWQSAKSSHYSPHTTVWLSSNICFCSGWKKCPHLFYLQEIYHSCIEHSFDLSYMCVQTHMAAKLFNTSWCQNISEANWVNCVYRPSNVGGNTQLHEEDRIVCGAILMAQFPGGHFLKIKVLVASLASNLKAAWVSLEGRTSLQVIVKNDWYK